MAENDSLSPYQTRAIAALLHSSTNAEAADAAGISESTLYRYLSDNTFKTALRDAQDKAIESAISLLSGEARAAAKTLVEIHKDESVNPAVRVQAARAVLIENLKVRDKHEVIERIEELEKRLP